MHQKYEQGREGGGGQGETKINENTESGLHLENIRKLAFWLNGDV